MKKINLARALERLKGRYDLQDLVQELFKMAEVVIPITNLDDLVKDWDVFAEDDATRAAASGAGWIDVLTVSKGYRYSVRAVGLTRYGGGDGTFTILKVLSSITNGSVNIYSQSAGASLNSEILPQDVVLESGDKIQAYVSAITGDTTWYSRWWGYKEKWKR